MTKFTIKHVQTGVPPVAVEVKEATTIVLGIVLSHVAEIFEGIVGAVAEHYKIDPKEMMEVVKNHPSVTQIALHPAISDLGYMPELKEFETVPSSTNMLTTLGEGGQSTSMVLGHQSSYRNPNSESSDYPYRAVAEVTQTPPVKTKKFKIKKNTIE